MEQEIVISRSYDKKTYTVEIGGVAVFGDKLKQSLNSIDLYSHGCYICSIFEHPMITWYDPYEDTTTNSVSIPDGWRTCTHTVYV